MKRAAGFATICFLMLATGCKNQPPSSKGLDFETVMLLDVNPFWGKGINIIVHKDGTGFMQEVNCDSGTKWIARERRYSLHVDSGGIRELRKRLAEKDYFHIPPPTRGGIPDESAPYIYLKLPTGESFVAVKWEDETNPQFDAIQTWFTAQAEAALKGTPDWEGKYDIESCRDLIRSAKMVNPSEHIGPPQPSLD